MNLHLFVPTGSTNNIFFCFFYRGQLFRVSKFFSFVKITDFCSFDATPSKAFAFQQQRAFVDDDDDDDAVFDALLPYAAAAAAGGGVVSSFFFLRVIKVSFLVVVKGA